MLNTLSVLNMSAVNLIAFGSSSVGQVLKLTIKIITIVMMQV